MFYHLWNKYRCYSNREQQATDFDVLGDEMCALNVGLQTVASKAWGWWIAAFDSMGSLTLIQIMYAPSKILRSSGFPLIFVGS